MAVNDETQAAGNNNNNRQQQQQQGAPRQDERRQQTNGQAAQQPQQHSLLRRNYSGIRIGNRSVRPEIASKLSETFDEVIKQNLDPAFKHTVFTIGEEANMGISVLVVALQIKDKPSLGIAYYTLLLEATSAEPAQRFENVNTGMGQTINVEVQRTTGNRFGPQMVNVIENELRRRFPNTPLLSADAMVVPRDFNVDDKKAVTELANMSFYAPGTVLSESVPGFQDLNLVDLPKDAQLTLRPQFGNNVESNVVGDPVRSDITMVLTASPLNNQNQMDDNTVELFRTSAYVDLVFDPMQAPPQQYGYQQAAPTQLYVPRIVLTKLESEDNLTTGVQLFGLAQIAALIQQGNPWMQTFFTRNTMSGGKKGINWRDPGALNYEANLEKDPSGYGTAVDTNAADFDDNEMMRYLTSVIRTDTFMVSQDVPLCDPTTWYLSALLAAAQGNIAAEQHVIGAANQLTNGAFGRYFPEGARFVVTENEHIHMGYYDDAQGNRRDIRDVDLPAILNIHGKNDPKMGQKWTDTFLATDVPELIRLHDRKEMILNITHGKITGMAVRINYTMDAINALIRGCADAGLDVKSQMSFAGYAGRERHRAHFSQSAMMGSGQLSGGFLNRGMGMGGPVGGQYQTGGGYSRWGR